MKCIICEEEIVEFVRFLDNPIGFNSPVCIMCAVMASKDDLEWQNELLYSVYEVKQFEEE